MERLSILIANRNTLSFLQLCIKSLRENLARDDHAILVLDDASTDGSAEWLAANRSRYGYELHFHRGPDRMGIVGAYNHLVNLAPTPVVWMVHTDMYFAEKSDEETARYLAPATVCTCTRIEPPLYPGAPHKIVSDLGTEPSVFREEDFLRLAQEKAQPGRYTEGIFAPMMCFKEDFLAVDGLDPAFAPQSKEDSDLFNRMAVAGYRFRQSWSAFCYHFSGRGSRKKDGIQKDSGEWQLTNRKNERNFIRRWGSMVRHDEFLKPIVPPPEPISLVALLGQEPDNMIPFLENVEPFMDEIVFVADGPQLKSIARIEEYVRREEAMGSTVFKRDKIRVLERPLEKNFAAQRNFGQENCRFDWVLHADLDERFDRGLLENLRDLIRSMRKSDKTVCGFPRLSYLDGVLVNDLPRDQWTPEGLAEAGKQKPSEVRSLDPQFRLLKRDVRWHGEVHETPEALIRSPENVTIWQRACIRHPKSLPRQKEQDARYEAIIPGASLQPGSVCWHNRNGLRILMLATEYPPAKGYGLARYAEELAVALVSEDHELHVATVNVQSAQSENQTSGMYVHDMRNPLPIHHYDWVGDAVLGNVFMLDHALNIARQHGPFDVIISHDWLAAHTAKSLKSILRIPWLLVMHDTEIGKRGWNLPPPQTYIAQMEKWAGAHADHLLTTSEYMRNELIRVCDIGKDSISVVPCGVTPERFLGDACLSDFRALFVQENQPVIAYVGRLSPMKGVEELAEAFVSLAKTIPECRLIIAGEGVLRDPIGNRLREAGLENQVIFAGWLSDKLLGALYQIADAVILPSRYEPFGLAAIEAASCGGVVIASETGGLAEIIGNSSGAIKGVPPRDPHALKCAIERTLEERNSNSSLRQMARDYAAGYSWKRTAREVSALIETMLATRKMSEEGSAHAQLR